MALVALLSSFSLSAWADEEVVLTEEGASAPPPSAPAADSKGQPAVEENAGVMVRPFTGPKAQTIHDRVISTLEAEGIILIPEGFEEGVKLSEAPGPYVEVARKNQIKAYLHGQTKMTRKAWSVTIKVRNGNDGKAVSSVTLTNYSLPGLLKKIDKDLMSTLDEHLLKTSVPGGKPAAAAGNTKKSAKKGQAEEGDAMAVSLEAEPEGGDPAADSEPTAPAEESVGDPKALQALDVAAGLGVTQRTMQYQTGLADVYEYPLLPHTGFTTITLRLGAHWYPGTYFYKDGVLPNIGLAMNLLRSVGGSTQVKDGTGEVSKFDTTFTEFNIGLRGRLQLKGIELGLNGGWGTQSLVLDGDNETPTGAMEKDPGIIPDAGYSYFRFGPDVHFELGAPIEAGLFYRMVTLDDEEGYLKEARWFPNAAAIGLDAFAQVNIALTKKIQLQLGGEARYYGVKANPGAFADTTDGTGNATPGAQGQPGLTRAVAAGVTDVYLGAFASAYFTMPGTAH